MKIKIGTPADVTSVYNLLENMMEGVDVPFEMFEKYYKDSLKTGTIRYFILEVDNEDVAIVTVNKYHIPRYAGYTYEMEEVFIKEHMRGKGCGKYLMEQIIEECKKDKLCRKVTVKTNSEEPKKLYRKYFDDTSYAWFQKPGHYLPLKKQKN